MASVIAVLAIATSPRWPPTPASRQRSAISFELGREVDPGRRSRPEKAGPESVDVVGVLGSEVGVAGPVLECAVDHLDAVVDLATARHAGLEGEPIAQLRAKVALGVHRTDQVNSAG